MSNTARVNAALEAEGLPVRLERERDYHYFVFDNGTAFETESVMVARTRDRSTRAWIEDGRAFAAKIEAQLAERGQLDAEDPQPFRLRITRTTP